MARAKSAYVCAECGASALQWFGSCPSCGVAGSLTETAIEKNAPHRYAAQAVKAIALETVDAKELERIASCLPELDRALGGGLVAGQGALLGRDPGLGQSTPPPQRLPPILLPLPRLYLSRDVVTGQ